MKNLVWVALLFWSANSFAKEPSKDLYCYTVGIVVSVAMQIRNVPQSPQRADSVVHATLNNPGTHFAPITEAQIHDLINMVYFNRDWQQIGSPNDASLLAYRLCMGDGPRWRPLK